MVVGSSPVVITYYESLLISAKGSILGPMFFLIYVKDLSDDLTSNPKFFADDTPLFSVVQNMTNSANDVNNDSAKINTCAFQWKMNFNPDLTKQAQEVIF